MLFRSPDEDFDRDYLVYVSAYFHFFKPCIRKMRKALQDPLKTNVTHKYWLSCLGGALTEIPRERPLRWAPKIATNEDKALFDLFNQMHFINASSYIKRQQLRINGHNPNVDYVPGVVTDDGIGFFYLDVAKERAKEGVASGGDGDAATNNDPSTVDATILEENGAAVHDEFRTAG